MSLRTVPGMINVKTPIGSAVTEFNRSRAAQMPKVKEGWTMGAAAQANDKGSMPKAEDIVATAKKTTYPKCPQDKINVHQKGYGGKDRLPISCECEVTEKRSSSSINCPCKTEPKEYYGPRAEVRGQNPNSIYSDNAPHVVEGWRAKNTRKTVKAIVIVLIVVVVIMLIACMLMKMMKPKTPVIFSRYVDLDALASSPSTSTIKYPEVPTVDGMLLFGGKMAKKSSPGKRSYGLGKKVKKSMKNEGKKKAIRKLNEVYSADDEELI